MVSDKVKRKVVYKNENCSFLHILTFHWYRPVYSVEFLKKKSFTLLYWRKYNIIPDASCVCGYLIYSWEYELENESGFIFVFIGSKNTHYLHILSKYSSHYISQVSFSKFIVLYSK